ncbi:MAG: hypothetical protein LUC99_08095 [Clostridiales bacterium]|nr:hypothetical protein [Clostridiales bacterium]
MKSQIIIMLTHNDKTVKNAYEVFESCKDLPVQFWGFKDVGVPKEEMKRIVDAMKAAGKTTFLEVVSYSEEECMRGAKLAVELGYDYLMGTVYHQSVFEYLGNQNIKFLPFCGQVSGSPSILEGTFEEIIDDAKGLLARGVDGIDLLAFRHKDGAGLAEAYCAAIDKPVVIAGSINSPERLEFINRINPWAFTMGSALFTENFAPGKSFRENLEAVIHCMDSIG